MARRVCVIEGHPEAGAGHFCDALAAAYARGAEAAGAEVVRLALPAIAPEPLGGEAEFATAPEGPMATARAEVAAADHLVIVFPLWLGGMPARLKAFFEQLARAGFALEPAETGWPVQKLKGRSARIVVTMGMPAIAYRVWFLNCGVSVLRRMILGLAGVGPIRQTTIGGVGGLSDASARRRLARMERLGRALR